MPRNLIIRVQSPIVVLSDLVEFSDTMVHYVRFRSTKDEKELFLPQYPLVRGVYGPDEKALWQNIEFRVYHKLILPRKYKGTQIVFTDRVFFEGTRDKGRNLQFYFNEADGLGEPHRDPLPIEYFKAVFDPQANIRWEARR